MEDEWGENRWEEDEEDCCCEGEGQAKPVGFGWGTRPRGKPVQLGAAGFLQKFAASTVSARLAFAAQPNFAPSTEVLQLWLE